MIEDIIYFFEILFKIFVLFAFGVFPWVVGLVIIAIKIIERNL